MKNKNKKLSVINCTLSTILVGLVLSVSVGCQEVDKKDPLMEKNIALRQANKELTRQFKKFATENKKAKEQIQVLSGLKPEVRLENLYDLQKVKLTRYTNIYDKDKDGRYEKLIVYIQPLDAENDTIKAAGYVDVQLWDLNKKQNQALIGQWQVEPSELKKLWFATLVTINYRLTFDLDEIIDNFNEPLTIKVTFTDYLSGKVFKEQRVIKPR